MGSPSALGLSAPTRRGLLEMSGYQWTVLFAAWLGWGFDCFEIMLFNIVAPNCVPTLLHLEIGSAPARAATLYYTGVLSSLLLVGWAIGGILFGHVCDRIGRRRTMVLTMGLYSVGTALCAAAPNIATLILFRLIASLGIGGEWAAGASMVAEVVPERRRVEAGALLFTASPLGLFLASQVAYLVQGVAFPGSPELAWRYVFLAGLIPAGVAVLVRRSIREPERWTEVARTTHPRLAELFRGSLLHPTLSGLGLVIVALTTWWSCNAFIGVVASGLAEARAAADGLDRAATQVLIQEWIRFTTNLFNAGGVLGTLLTIPLAKYGGRRLMFAAYALLSAAAVLGTFGLELAPEQRLYGYFFIGLGLFGIFGAFTFYLPELFPTRLRGTGAGFCFNAGRFIAAFGPLVVGGVAARGRDALATALGLLFWVGFVPLCGLALLPWVIETRHRELLD
ncbi:MAG TPA: MFS transporter [Candidatus Polarisedimenticolaceae bacterium]|nr:MFS transporter [Candidatus Polarisedimenticolaceae bacterium]